MFLCFSNYTVCLCVLSPAHSLTVAEVVICFHLTPNGFLIKMKTTLLKQMDLFAVCSFLQLTCIHNKVSHGSPSIIITFKNN